jgi:hypothetical protein
LGGVGTAFAALWTLLLVLLLLAALASWFLLRYFRLRQQWRAAGVLQTMITARRSRLVVCFALFLRWWSKGLEYWPSRYAYWILGGTTPEQRQAVKAKLATMDAVIRIVRVAQGDEPSAHPSFAAAWSELFPRWKACVLLFVGLTVVTVFVPQHLAWGAFCLASAFVTWRGYRDASIPAWGDAIRLGLLGAFVGTLLWALLAVPLQRNGLVRLSRDIYIAAPEWFLCCIWDGRSKGGDP